MAIFALRKEIFSTDTTFFFVQVESCSFTVSTAFWAEEFGFEMERGFHKTIKWPWHDTSWAFCAQRQIYHRIEKCCNAESLYWISIFVL